MPNLLQDFLGNMSLIAAAWVVAGNTPRRENFWARTAICFVVLCLARYVYFDVLLAEFSGAVLRGFNMLGFAVLMLMTAGAAALSFDCSFWTALFCGSVGYSLQHICQRTYMILSKELITGQPQTVHVLVYVSIITMCMVLSGLLMNRLKIDRIVVDNKYLLLASMLVVGSTTVLDLLFFWAMRAPGYALRYCIWTSSILISLLTVALQFSMVTSKRREIELDTIKILLEEERRQYFFEKSMIEMVNIKCHDLKHQLAAMDKEGQNKLREDIRPVIDAYDSSFRTGNVALDVVLTRENFNCKEKNVKLTCVANGDCLNFLSEVDVYSLFGNILDNAIEATEKLEDPEKRVISLTVSREGYFVNIHAENYYSDKLTFTDGLPETTKLDTIYHGYGLKSIRMLVQKYDGSLKISTNEDRFVLDILFST